MRAEPGQAERQRHADRRDRAEQVADAGEQRDQRDDEARAVDDRGGGRRAADAPPRRVRGRASGDADRASVTRHGAGPLSRHPRPPPELAAFSAISSMPAASSAATSFISESTLPRMTPSLASMRWMVGSDKSGQLGQLALVDAEKRPRGPELCG